MNRRVQLLGSSVVACVLAVLAVGCRNEELVVPVERPPLLFRSSVPADSAEGFFEPDGITLSITFRRELFDGEIATSLLVPRPVSTGALVLGRNSPRELLWEDVVLDPAVNSYRWLVDGPSMLGPILITFHPADPIASSGRIVGEAKIGPPHANAGDAVIYALQRAHRAGDAPLDSLLGYPVASIALVLADSPGQEGQTFVVLDLRIGDPYFLVAVLDTNGDGQNVPGEDWWGVARLPSLEPRLLYAGSPWGQPDEGVVVELAPPGTFDAGGFR